MMTNKKQLYLIGAFVIFGIISAIITIGIYNLTQSSGSSSSVAKDPKMNEYTDPASGDTILSPEGKAPDKYGVNPDAPIYVGFSELVSRGLSPDQVASIKAALLDYVVQVKETGKITEVSLKASSITHAVDTTSGDSYYDFQLLVNRKDTYFAHVVNPDIATIRLTLYKGDDKTPVFSATKP